MKTNIHSFIRRFLCSAGDLLLGLALSAVFAIIIVPLPALLLDILITLNLSFAFLIFFKSVIVKKASDFSSFPSVLIFSAIFRLAISISSVRLILVKGIAFDGQIICVIASLVAGSKEIADLAACFLIYIGVVLSLITLGIRLFEFDVWGEEEMSVFFGLRISRIFISVKIKTEIIITAITIVLGIFINIISFEAIGNALQGNTHFSIGTVLYGEMLGTVLRTYIPLSIGNSIISLFTDMLLIIAVGNIITKEKIWNNYE